MTVGEGSLWTVERQSAYLEGIQECCTRTTWNATRKASAHMKSNLVREVKIKTREKLGLPLNEVSALVMQDSKKVELLNAFFSSVFTAKTALQEPQTLEIRECEERKNSPWWKKI